MANQQRNSVAGFHGAAMIYLQIVNLRATLETGRMADNKI